MKYKTKTGSDVVELERKVTGWRGFVIMKPATSTTLAVLKYQQWSIGTDDLIQVS